MGSEVCLPLLRCPSCMLMSRTDLHKTYVDDEHYNSGHGHAYEMYGVDPQIGAVVIVRPDQCESKKNLRILSVLTRGRCIESRLVG